MNITNTLIKVGLSPAEAAQIKAAFDTAEQLPVSGGGGSDKQLLNTEAHTLTTDDIGKGLYFDASGVPQIYAYFDDGYGNSSGAMFIGVLVGVPSTTSIELALNYVLVKKSALAVWTAADLSGFPDPMLMGAPLSFAVIDEGGTVRQATELDGDVTHIGVVVEPSSIEEEFVLVKIVDRKV